MPSQQVGTKDRTTTASMLPGVDVIVAVTIGVAEDASDPSESIARPSLHGIQVVAKGASSKSTSRKPVAFKSSA